MAKRKINEKGLLCLIIGVILVILILFFSIKLLFGGASGVVNDYAKGMKNFDSEMLVDLYIYEMIKESYDSEEDMIKEFDSMFEEMENNYFQIISYDVNKSYKEYEGEELDYKINQLEEYYKIEDTDIKEIRRYTVIFDCSVDSEMKEVEHKVNVAKIKNKWYFIGTE